MTRISASIDLAVSPDLCIHAIQASLGDERLHAAHRALRPGKEYSGWVTALEPGRSIEVTVAALDPATNKRMYSLGWVVRYTFTPLDGGRTRAEVAVEYGRKAAIAGMGLVRAQAENDVSNRLRMLHALEFGVHAATAGR